MGYLLEFYHRLLLKYAILFGTKKTIFYLHIFYWQTTFSVIKSQIKKEKKTNFSKCFKQIVGGGKYDIFSHERGENPLS